MLYSHLNRTRLYCRRMYRVLKHHCMHSDEAIDKTWLFLVNLLALRARLSLRDQISDADQVRSARSHVHAISCAPKQSQSDLRGDLLPRTFRRRETGIGSVHPSESGTIAAFREEKGESQLDEKGNVFNTFNQLLTCGIDIYSPFNSLSLS